MIANIVIPFLVGIVTSFLVSYFYLEKKTLEYEISSKILISDKCSILENLHISYMEDSIENLYESTIIFRNLGNRKIDNIDFDELYPLSLTAKEFFLIGENKEEHKQEISSGKFIRIEKNALKGSCQTAIIDFSYLAKKEVLEFKIYHTGTLICPCKLKEGKVINKKYANEKFYKFKSILIFVTVGSVALIVSGIFRSSIDYLQKVQQRQDVLMSEISELEKKNDELMDGLSELEKKNDELMDELSKLEKDNGVLITEILGLKN